MIIIKDVLEILRYHLQMTGLPNDCPGASPGRSGSRCDFMQDVAELARRSQESPRVLKAESTYHNDSKRTDTARLQEVTRNNDRSAVLDELRQTRVDDLRHCAMSATCTLCLRSFQILVGRRCSSVPNTKISLRRPRCGVRLLRAEKTQLRKLVRFIALISLF